MKRELVLLLLPLALPALSFGQGPVRPSSAAAPLIKLESKHPAQDLRRVRVISLVEQTANEAVWWDDRDGAVVALAEAADLLWDDTPNARGWLIKAWELIGQVDERENGGDLRQIWRGSQRSYLRTRILTVARKRDPQLAERFISWLEANKVDDQGERGAFDDRTARSEQLLRLALSSVEANPALALALAERSLQDGISFNVQTVLLRLRQKDSKLADHLFDSALARMANSTSAFEENQILASYLFKPGEVLTQLPNGTTTVAIVQTQLPMQTPAQADPNRAKRFLAMVQHLLLSAPLPIEEQQPRAGEFVLLAASLAPAFQLYAPELWPPIQARSAQFAAKLPAPRADSNSSEDVREAAGSDATAEEVNRLRVATLEKEAERQSNPIARKFKFAEAALATLVQDLERGKSLAGRIENDDELRDQIVAFLSYRAALTFLRDNNLRKAEEVALLIPSSAERALALIAVAQKLAAKPRSEEEKPYFETNRQRAIELLFEADKSLKREGGSAQTAKIRLGKIAVSNLVDAAQAFSDFEQAIPVINRLDKFDATDGSAPRFGIEAFRTSKLTVPRLELGFGFRSALEPLIRQDFDLTAATVERLASPSVRGACRLEIARQVLQSLPKPAPAKVAHVNVSTPAPH
jgi:hypothetical protein